jgi:hypothetical protein
MADFHARRIDMGKANKTFIAAAGVLLAASAGSASAAYGYNNGYYGGGYNGGYGATIRCESRDNRTTLCPVDTRAGVQLVDQTSRNSCIRGRTWGADSRGIWVAGGCRGIFAINTGAYGNGAYGYNGYGNGAYGNGAYGNGAYGYDRYGSNGYYGRNSRVVRCESRDGRTRYCGMDTRYGVSLVNQHSSSPCIRGSTWGVSRDRVWVSRGCRGDFATGASGYGYNNGYYDRRY